METYLEPWRKFAQFSGRSSRKEYWTFTLVNAGIYFILNFLFGIAQESGSRKSASGGQGIFAILLILFWFATIIPSWAVSVRRLHDTNRSGWWLLLLLLSCIGGLVLFVFDVMEGDIGENSYGPDPYDDGVMASNTLIPPPPYAYSELSPKPNPEPTRKSSGYQRIIPLLDMSPTAEREFRRDLKPVEKPEFSSEEIQNKVNIEAKERVMYQRTGTGRQEYLSEPRKQHYAFAHVHLRDRALKRPAVTVDELTGANSLQYLKVLWTRVGMGSKNPNDEFIPADELELHNFRIGGTHRGVIIKFPEPKGPVEAFMAAIVIPADAKPGDHCRGRYFTLELCLEHPSTTALCEWSDFGHKMLTESPPPILEDFEKAIVNMYTK